MKAIIWLSLIFLLADRRLAAITDQRIVDVLGILPYEVRLKDISPPGTDLTTCGGFWGQTGFVCNKEKLTSFALKEFAEAENLHKDFLIVANILEKINHGLKSMDSKIS